MDMGVAQTGGMPVLYGNGNNGSDFNNNPWWPLVWLGFLSRGGFGFGGGESAGAAQADLNLINQKLFDSALANSAQTTQLQGQLANGFSGVTEAINRSAADAAACCCDTRLDAANQGALTREVINNGTFVTQGGFKDLALQNCQSFNALSAQLAQCCCDTQKEILSQSAIIQGVGSSINNNIQAQTFQLNEAATRNTQSILDAINNQTMNELQDKLAQCRNELSNCQQTGNISTIQNVQTQQITAAITAAMNQILTLCGCSCNNQRGPQGQAA